MISNIIKNKFLIISVLFLTSFLCIHYLFQNNYLYGKLLKPFAKNYIIENGEKKLARVPYIKVTNENFIQWDGIHYNFIKKNGYNIEKAEDDYIFAFFPLFPFIWKISLLPPIGIFFLNYLFFCLGSFLILNIFNVLHNKFFVLLFCLPGLVVFLIPYTEAAFYLFLAIGISGFYRNKYWLFFIGFALASMTRPSVILLLASFVGIELFYLIKKKEILTSFKSITYRILPIITGTFIVSLLQLSYGSGSLTRFIEVQSRWGKSLAFPEILIDWSHEGFSLNLSFLVIFIPILFFYIFLCLKQMYIKGKLNSDKFNYLKLLSIFYLILSTLTTVLFQNGSLNGLFRYTICTPFFLIFLISFYSDLAKIDFRIRILILFLLLSSVAILLTIIPYSSNWNFSDMGFFILSLFTSLWFFNEKYSVIPYKLILYLTLFINILWTTYLFNAYISNGWIFT